MGFDLDDLDKIAKWAALIAMGVQEIRIISENKQKQAGRTEEETLQHAKEADARAREIINSL